MKRDNKKTGNAGENAAERHLINTGYEILDRNFRYSVIGELDIVAKKDGVLIFVEVKTDRTGAYGEPEMWVSVKKQRQIARVAEYYLMVKKCYGIDCRFDVIGVKIRNSEIENIVHIENAFIS